MELSIDTSSKYAGIALSSSGDIFAEYTWKTDKNHSTELIPNIEILVKNHKLKMEACTAIFIATGPGSFNGLRVGISAAKGLTLALNIPIVGINTLEIEAFGFAWSAIPVCAIHNAGRGEIAAAIYRKSNEWYCIKEPYITTVAALCEQIEETTVFCGEIPNSVADQLHNTLGNRSIIPGDIYRMRRSSFLAKLAWGKFNSGYTDNPITLQPLYLRQPPITQRKTK